MVLTRQREVALAGSCLILFGKIIPTFLYETSCEARVGFSLYDHGDHGGRGGCGSVGLDFVLPRIMLWVQGAQARILREFCSSVGLSPIKFHTLRACFATQLISSGVEPIKVMKVCGWRDLKTMGGYIRLSGITEMGITDSIKLLM